MQALADEKGFPSPLDRASVAQFDRPATRILHEVMEIVPADAASEEVWNFVTLVLLPDVATWRFPDRSTDRMLGRPRNVFRRLWWRAEIVGSDLIDISDGLGEDELVNIMERSTLAASPALARAVAQAVVLRGSSVKAARSELMRDLAKRVLRAQAVLCIEALDSGAVSELVERCLAESISSLAPSPPRVISRVAEGWLIDPTGAHELRWWDGVRWTEHVSDAGVVSQDPM